MKNYNPLYDFWFWLAFWGFAVIVVYGIALLRIIVPSEPPEEAEKDPNFWDRVREFRIINRPWYYVIPIWEVIASAAISACEGFLVPTTHIPIKFSIFVFSVGCSYVGGYYFLRFGSGTPINTQLAERVRTGIVIGVVGAVAVMFALGFRLSLKRTNDIAQQAVTVTAGQVKADTTTPPATKRSLDSITSVVTNIDSALRESLKRQAIKDSLLTKDIHAIKTNTTPTARKR